MMSPRPNKVIPRIARFDYAVLNPKEAEKVRLTAQRIRNRIKRTAKELVDAGKELLEVKALLPHGHFGPWLKAEFDWTDRTARRLMDVAEQFGDKSDMMSDMKIAPTALYLLAATSTPFQVRQLAFERAQTGEVLTFSTVCELISAFRNQGSTHVAPFPAEKLMRKLKKVLIRLQNRCHPNNRREFAKKLRAFAVAMDRAP